MSLDSGQIRYPFETPPDEGEAIEVADGILWFRFPLPMKLDHVNVFAFDDGDSWTIIDTGFDTKRARAIWQTVLEGPLSGKPVGRVLATHHHPDHIGLAGWFQTEFGAELLMTRTAWTTGRMLQMDEQERPVPQSLAFWKLAGMAAEVFEKRAVERPFNFSDMVAWMPVGYSRIKEGSRLTIGGRDWIVHIGNGHAPEHATLYSNDGDLVIGGDQLLPSISPVLGVYPTEPEADPVAEWLEACAFLAPFATEEQLVLPGHKLPFTGLPHRMGQLADNHHGALDRLRKHLVKPSTAGQCFLPIFKREIRGGEYGLALSESYAHCIHLWHKGEVTRTLDENGAYLWEMI